MRNDKFQEDESFIFVAFLVLAIPLIILVLSFYRRSGVAKKVCPSFCEMLYNEDFYATKLTDYGIQCICKGKPRKPKRIP